MDFNVSKCVLMHIGKRNLEIQYQMNDGWVKSVDEEKDLGMLMSKDLKFSKYCLLANNKANLILGLPINEKDADMLKGLQRRATKMIQI